LEETAASFTPALNYTLNQIDLGFTNYAGGTVIESWNLNEPFPAVESTNNTRQTITPTGTVSLTAGTEYWLVVTPQASNTQMYWELTTAGYRPGRAAFHRDAGGRRKRAACALIRCFLACPFSCTHASLVLVEFRDR
jgi:hypothetical protein